VNFTWDWNEWFMVITSVAATSLFLLIRKSFPTVLIIAIWVYITTMVATADYFIAATPFKLYYCADNTSYEPTATMIHVFTYPPFAFFLLYFYERWKLRGVRLWIYIAVWSVFSAFFEWINVVNGVFTYTGWKLLYSVPVYLLSQVLLIYLYRNLRNWLDEPIPA